MSVKKVLGCAFVYLVLELGALCGVPMDPRKIEELMQVLKRSSGVTEQQKNGDDTPPDPVFRDRG